MSTFVLPLADPNATLETVGGKGMSLAKMAQANLPVPQAFYLTTAGYRCFVAENRIQDKILSILHGIDLEDAAALPRLESISQQIGAYFMQGVIPPEIAGEVAEAYTALSDSAVKLTSPIAVAVRSSATAEDLPGASFAGQQDTYLNICGTEAVLAAIKQCWASLWTARAITYRARQGMAPESVALAVVVQELVFADASGILFTANPISGKRDEMMITATWGLGESIVSGKVTPDTLIVAKTTGKVIRRETCEKQVMTVRGEAGTHEQPVPRRLQKSQVLSSAQSAELARLGMDIERLYGIPMDVEWAFANGSFAIVQARPITSLPEPPLEWVRDNKKALIARQSFAEFVPEPVSPLFATLAVPIAAQESQKMMSDYMGMGSSLTYLFQVINGYVYVGMEMTPSALWKALSSSWRQALKLMKTANPRWAAARTKLQETAEKWQQNPAALSTPMLLTGAREIFRDTAAYFNVGQTGAIPIAPMSEMLFSRFYQALVKGKHDPDPSIFLLGFDTISLRAEKSLFDFSCWVQEQPELAEAILNSPTEIICAALDANPIPGPYAGAFADRFSCHLDAYGHVLYDLDFAKPIPTDSPAPLIEAMKMYLSGSGVSPYERQKAQVERREQAEQAILKRLDPLRRKWFTKALHWAQKSSPDRENCIADMGLGYPQLRRLLGELGRRLFAGGVIARPEDVYWLEAEEVDAIAAALEAGEALTPQMDKIERRKAFMRRAQSANPPVSLPDKSFITRLIVHHNPEGSTLKGYAASAGRVTAPACVLRGPEEFSRMRPGDVIVAVSTTPAWTPLFAMASAVVTDIGGPLSHSSIVAREYGIPAVMATGVASRRIQHQQMITVDGTAGTVTLLV